MTNSACYVLKKAVIASALLIFLGFFLELIATFIAKDLIYNIVLVYSGFFSIVASFILIIAIFLAVLLPSVNNQLKQCQH